MKGLFFFAPVQILVWRLIESTGHVCVFVPNDVRELFAEPNKKKTCQCCNANEAFALQKRLRLFRPIMT